MQIKFISNSGQVSEIIFLILSNKNALKKIGLGDNLLLDVLKALENKGFGFNKDEIIEINNIKDKKVKSVFIYGLGNKIQKLSSIDFEKIGGKITQLTKSKRKKNVNILVDEKIRKNEELLRLGYGCILGSYRFDKYKTK